MSSAIVATPTPVKRSGSQAGLDDLCSPHDDLSPLAKRIPKVRRVGDSMEQRRRDLQRSCLVKLVDWAVKHEELVPKVWSALEAGQVLFDDGPKAGFFAEPPKTIRNIEKSWKARFLIDLGDGAISNELMADIDSRDEHAIHEVFCMLTKTFLGSESLPREFIDQRLLAAAMRARHEEVLPHFNMKHWAREHIAANGTIAWQQAGPYTYTFSPTGQLAEVTHVSGAKASVPKHMVIDNEFQLKQCAYDMSAQFVNGPVQHMVHKLFGKGEGPNKFAFDRKGMCMRSLLHHAQAAIAQAEKSTTISSDDGLKLRDHAKERRAAALEKAREKMRSAASKEKGRCIQLAPMVS